MKKIFSFLSIVTFGFCLSCSNAETKNDGTNKDTTANNADSVVVKNEDAEDLDTASINYFQNASYGGMVEVESSAKILQSAKDELIKSFATMMTKDHGDANRKLKELAAKKGYTLPAILPVSKMAAINKMNELKEEGRDEYYINLMVEEHKKAIDIFSIGSQSKDIDIANFSQKTLPIIKHHYQEVIKIDSLLQVPKANQGDDILKQSNRKKS